MRIKVNIIQSKELDGKSNFYNYICTEVNGHFDTDGGMGPIITTPWKGPYPFKAYSGLYAYYVRELEMTTDVNVELEPQQKLTFLRLLQAELKKIYDSTLPTKQQLNETAKQVQVENFSCSSFINCTPFTVFSNLKRRDTISGSHENITASNEAVEHYIPHKISFTRL